MEYKNCGECKFRQKSSDISKYWCRMTDEEYDIDYMDLPIECTAFRQSEESKKIEKALEEYE